MADAHPNVVLNEADIGRALTRIAHEIVERNKGLDEVLIIGIPSRGVPLAQRLVAQLQSALPPGAPPLGAGALDITMYRDDLAASPTRALARTQLPAGGIDGRTVVLVDDVLYSGRTVRAALDALSAEGRPRAVQLAVLVDRGHRQLPIRADYIGKNLPTSRQERVGVRLREVDGFDAVELRQEDS